MQFIGVTFVVVISEDPCIVNTLDIDHLFSEVGESNWIAWQYLSGSKEVADGLFLVIFLGFATCQQVVHRERRAKSDLGDGVTKCFEDRDTGIVSVIVGP